MKQFKKLPFLLLCLMLCVHKGSSTLLIPSLLMAMSTGGLLMGKMTLGGLFMMLMAANERQTGQSLFQNLGVIPRPSPSTGISVPADGNVGEANIQDLIVRRRRYLLRQKRGIRTNITLSTMSKNTTHEDTNWINPQIQYRIMRQVASTDPLNCLPNALCGISASPPSTQSGFLNDYAYLLKTVLNRDEDIDDLDKGDEVDDLEEDFNALKYSNNKNKKPGTKSSSSTKASGSKQTKKTKKKKPEQDDEDSEEEDDEPVYDEELKKAMIKEQYEVEDMANDELLDDDPGYLPYAVRDTVKKYKLGSGPPSRPYDIPSPKGEHEYDGISPMDLHKMTDEQLDRMLTKMRTGNGPNGPTRNNGGNPEKTLLSSGGSFLSKFIPKFSMGFSQTSPTTFDDDKFYAGFKRSIDPTSGNADEGKVRQATAEEEKLFKEMRERRRQRAQYIKRKKEELSQIKDPVEKFRIASEFGERMKSPRQCRILFNNCPFNYTQMLHMIADLRKAVMGQPLTTPEAEKGRDKDTVVDLKPALANANNIFNLGGGSMGGVTSISHQLPTGETVEINLKMTKGDLSTSQRIKSRPNNNNKTPSGTIPPLFSMLSNLNRKKKPTGAEDLLNDVDGNKRPQSGALSSLESLKATMLAIEKINNVTVQRTKEGKPVTYEHVLAQLNSKKGATSSGSVVRKKTQNKDHNFENATLPEPSLITKLHKQNSQPKAKKRNNNAQKTASSLLASSLVKLEDDEIEEELPKTVLGKGTSIRVKGPHFPPKNKEIDISKSNEKLATLLSELKKVTSKTSSGDDGENTPKSETAEIQEDQEDGLVETDDENYEDGNTNDEEQQEEEYEEDDVENGSADEPKYEYKSPATFESQTDDEFSERDDVIDVPEQNQETTSRNYATIQTSNKRKQSSNSNKGKSKGKRRKPKKLYPGESLEDVMRVPPL